MLFPKKKKNEQSNQRKSNVQQTKFKTMINYTLYYNRTAQYGVEIETFMIIK